MTIHISLDALRWYLGFGCLAGLLFAVETLVDFFRSNEDKRYMCFFLPVLLFELVVVVVIWPIYVYHYIKRNHEKRPERP